MKVEIARFLIVGGVSTLLNYATFLLLYWFGVDYLVASATGFLSGVGLGYVLNKNWTYSVTEASTPSLVGRYLFVYLLSLVAGLGLIYILVDVGGLSPLISNVASICLTTCFNFIGTRFFVFK